MKKIIVTPRLTLRPFQKGDEAAAVEILCHAAVKQTYILPDLDDGGAKKLFDHFVRLSHNTERFVRAVCLDDTLIGWLNDTEISDDRIELGWVIHPSYWANGYATEAVRAAIAALHAEGFCCVYAGAFAENTASIRVMQKAGMRLLDKTEELEYRGSVHHCVYYGAYLQKGQSAF